MKVNAVLFRLILSAFFAISSCYGQSKTGKDFVVHSPNVANLGKFGDYAVDLSAGVPSINVPLYVVKSGSLELPITLKYHASGIKVEQESSFVGLGWVLNAGGVIARVLNDLPDEDSYYGFLTRGSSLPNYNSIDEDAAAGSQGNSEFIRFFSDDKEPDIFRIFAEGLGGEFCLDNAGQFVSIGRDSLQYNVDLHNKTIIIKDKKGIVYRFGKSASGIEAFETTQTRTETSTSSNTKETYFNSSFYLTEIISANQADTISFIYKSNYYHDRNVVSTSRNESLYPAYRGLNGSSNTIMNTTIPNMQVIDKIIFKNGTLEFTVADDRQDLKRTVSTSRIAGFKVYNKKRVLISAVEFDNNDYFIRTGSGSSINGQDLSVEKRKSLKLNSVKFYDKNGLFVNDFKFQYDQVPLPPRNTTPQDFWGYYNGRDHTSFIPENFFKSSATGAPQYVGVNRKTDYNFMKAAVLNKVTFPTGGYSTFDFEPNYYVNVINGENKVLQTGGAGVHAINRTGAGSCDHEFWSTVPENNVYEFTVTEDVTGPAQLNVYFSDYKYYNNFQTLTFKLTNSLNSEVITFSHSNSEKGTYKVYTRDLMVYKGATYRLEARTNGITGSNYGFCGSPLVDANLRYQYWQTIKAEDSFVTEQAGGLRIKKISSFNFDKSPIDVKSYEYGDQVYGVNRVGIGKLITDPSKNFYYYPLLADENGFVKNLKDFIWFNSSSLIELGDVNGCPLEYSKVTETLVSLDGLKSNGKTEYYFSGVRGYRVPGESKYFPYTFVKYPSWYKSEVEKKIIYSYESGKYTPINSVEYLYSSPFEKRIRTFHIKEVEPDIYYSRYRTDAFGGFEWEDSYNNPSRFYYYNSFVPRGKRLKNKEIIKDFVNGAVSSVRERVFNYNSYFDLSEEIYNNSNSDAVKITYKYSGDIDYPGKNSTNMVSLPIQEEETVNGKVRSGSIFTYNDYGQIKEIYNAIVGSLPSLYANYLTIPSNYQLDKSINYYSNKSIKSEVTAYSIPKTYIWSYNGEFPIAEIKTENVAELEAVLNGSLNISNFMKFNPTDSQVDSFLNSLRTSLPAAFIKGYTFNPLVGMSSSTDEMGKKIYYEYDNFQRLKYIKDQDGNIVKSHEYHFKL